VKHRAMQMADDLGPVLGKPIRKAPETKAQPAQRWEKTSTKGYLRDPATGAVARDADVPFDRQPLTKPASWIASGAAGEEVTYIGFDLASGPDRTAFFHHDMHEAAVQEFDGWIAHDGGECPIPDALGGEYEVRFDNGNVFTPDNLGATSCWGFVGYRLSSGITHYRLLPADHERKAREAIPVGEATEVHPTEADVRAANDAARIRAGEGPAASMARLAAIHRYGENIAYMPPGNRAACIAALNALAQPEPAKPAVQTMLVDGAAYREEPQTKYCAGCAFYDRGCGWCSASREERKAVFGGDCAERRAIYTRAEAA
jgi:hypothetical protein